jgi:hypothetical protein
MALKTLGTNATTTLHALVFQRGGMVAADVATYAQSVKNDLVNGNPTFPGAFEQGNLYVPNRCNLIILPGDYIAFDATGWPILISAAAIASGSTSWTHN